jgi:hypothetical protein
MAIQNINVGNIANDGTGDDLREAFIKVNNNFTNLDSRLTTIPVDVENLGVSGEGVYAGRNDNTLQFKKIIGGTNISITSNNNSLIVDASGGLGDILVLTEDGSLVINQGSNQLNIQGGAGINTRVSPTSSTVFVELETTGIVAQDSNPRLTANLNANNQSIQNVNTINSTNFIGPLTGLVYDIDVRDINKYFDNYWDFGGLVEQRYTSIIDYMLKQQDVDLGTFVGAGVVAFDIDLGYF